MRPSNFIPGCAFGMIFKSIHCLLCCTLIAAPIAGCTGSGGQQPPAETTLIYAQLEDPKTLDPINTDIAEAVHVLSNILDTLVTYHDETTEIVPGLAEHWEHSEHGLSWTFHLR